MLTNLPVKIDEDITYFTHVSNHLKEQITKIEKGVNLVGNNQVFVYFKNDFSVSIIQGWATFDDIEIAIKSPGDELLNYFEDDEGYKDQIYRTTDSDEIRKIMHDVSNL